MRRILHQVKQSFWCTVRILKDAVNQSTTEVHGGVYCDGWGRCVPWPMGHTTARTWLAQCQRGRLCVSSWEMEIKIINYLLRNLPDNPKQYQATPRQTEKGSMLIHTMTVARRQTSLKEIHGPCHLAQAP